MEQVLQAYSQLSDQNCQNTREITEFLCNFYSTYESFNILTRIIFDDTNQLIKRHAVIGIRSFIKKFYNQSNKLEIFSVLLDMYSYEGSEDVRRLVEIYIRDCMCPEVLGPTIKFIEMTCQNPTDINLYCMFSLLIISLNYQLETNINIEDLANKCLSTRNVRIQSVVMRYFLMSDLYNEDVDNKIAEQRFTDAVRFLCNVGSTDFEEFKELVKAILYIIDGEVDYIDSKTVFSMCLDKVVDDSFSLLVRAEIKSLCDSLIPKISSEIMVNFGDIFSKYWRYALEIYQSNDIFCDENNVFLILIEQCREVIEVIEFLFDQLSQISDEGAISLLLSAIYTLLETKKCYSFLDSNGLYEKFSRILVLGLQSDNYYTITVSASCISLYVSHQSSSVDDNTRGILLHNIIALFQKDHLLIDDGIAALHSLISSYENTDEIFDDVYKALYNISRQGIAVYMSLKCISSLIKNSQEAVSRNGEVIYESLNNLLNNEIYTSCKHIIINSLSHIVSKSKIDSKPILDISVQLLSSDDTEMQVEASKAIARVAVTKTDIDGVNIERFIDMMLKLTEKDLTPMEDDQYDEFMGDHDKELDNQYNLLVEGVVIPLKMATILLKQFYELIPSRLQFLISKYKYVLPNIFSSPKMVEFCMQSIGYIVEGLTFFPNKMDFKETGVKFLEISLDCLDRTFAGFDTGSSIETIVTCIANFGVEIIYNDIERVLNVIKSSFTQNCDDYSDVLHNNCSLFLRELLYQAKPGSQHRDFVWEITCRFIPIYRELFEKSGDFHFLIAEYFADVIVAYPENIDQNMIEFTYMLSKKLIDENIHYGLYAIKCITKAVPQFVTQKLDDVIEIVDNFLSPCEQDRELSYMQDNSVSLLGVIAINILDENFPAQTFLEKALTNMPAKEDMQECKDMYEFYVWLYERYFSVCPIYFAQCVCRFLYFTREKLLEFDLNDGQIEHLKKILKEVVTEVDVNQLPITSNVQKVLSN